MGLIQVRKKCLIQAKLNPPPQYRWIDYAESDGTAYITLPFVFSDTDIIEIYMSVDSSQTNDKYIVAPTTWNNNQNRFGIGIHGSRYTFAYGNTSTSNTRLTPNVYNDGELHKWFYKDHIISIPELETSKDVSSITFGGDTAQLKLFYGYNSNTKGKLAYYKHIKTNASYFLRPVQNLSTGTVEIYDTISKTFMTRSGTLLAPS